MEIEHRVTKRPLGKKPISPLELSVTKAPFFLVILYGSGLLVIAMSGVHISLLGKAIVVKLLKNVEFHFRNSSVHKSLTIPDVTIVCDLSIYRRKR